MAYDSHTSYILQPEVHKVHVFQGIYCNLLQSRAQKCPAYSKLLIGSDLHRQLSRPMVKRL